MLWLPNRREYLEILKDPGQLEMPSLVKYMTCGLPSAISLCVSMAQQSKQTFWPWLRSKLHVPQYTRSFRNGAVAIDPKSSLLPIFLDPPMLEIAPAGEIRLNVWIPSDIA